MMFVATRSAGPQPAADGPLGQRRRCGGEGAGVGRVDRGRQVVEQHDVGPGHVGLAGEDGHDVAPGDGVEQRQQLVAHPVAAERRVGIAGVVDGLEPHVDTQSQGLAPAQPPDRAPHRVHTHQPVEPGAAQQVQQHGLGLVVGRVAGQRVGRQRRVPGRPGPGLEVGPRAHVDPHRPEARPPARRRGPDHRGLVLRPRSQPVVHVDRRDLTPRLHRQHQQRQ
jgi:hypothetical protein